MVLGSRPRPFLRLPRTIATAGSLLGSPYTASAAPNTRRDALRAAQKAVRKPSYRSSSDIFALPPLQRKGADKQRSCGRAENGCMRRMATPSQEVLNPLSGCFAGSAPIVSLLCFRQVARL